MSDVTTIVASSPASRRRRVLRPLLGSAARFVASFAPELLVTFVEHWRTRNPLTFNEKILYKMARDRRQILTTFADKVLVRDYVTDRVGSDVLPALYANEGRADLIDWKALPREFVAKVNHGSGGVVVVSLTADPATLLPDDVTKLEWTRFFIHPDSLDVDALIQLLNRWLGMTYGDQKLRSVREWAYSAIAPQVLVVEYVSTSQTMPAQINIACIHGRPEEVVFYEGDRTFAQDPPHRFLRDEFETARRLLNVSSQQWDDVLTMCSRLSEPVDMVRVDWLITNRGFVFNELTNYPAAGHLTLVGNPVHAPQELNRILGDLWSVPQKY